MKKYLILLILILSSIVSISQTQVIVKVSNLVAVQTYTGTANRLYDSVDNVDYLLCPLCTVNGTTVVSGASGKKWLAFSIYSSSGDTTIFQNVIDSTLQNGQPILWARNNKIRSSTKLLYDSANNKMVINNSNISVYGNSTKLAVNGNVRFNGSAIANSFKTPTGTSSQFLKADGSVDANTYLLTSDFNSTFDTRFSTDTVGHFIGIDWLPTLAAKQNAITTGTTAQYFRGDLSLATFPTIPAQFNPIAGTNVTLSGSYPNITFNASGGSGSSTPDPTYQYLILSGADTSNTGGNRAALAATEAKCPNSGCVIFVPAGNLKLDSTYRFTKSVTLVGGGGGTLGQPSSDYVTAFRTTNAGTTMFEFTKANSGMYNILLWSTASSPTTPAIKVRAGGFRTDNLNVVGFSSAINTDSGAYNNFYNSAFYSQDSDVVIKNTLNPDDGDSKFFGCQFFSGPAVGKFANVVQRSSGGAKFIACKFNNSANSTQYAYYGDFNAGFTSNLYFDNTTSIENGFTKGIYLKSNGHFFGNSYIGAQFSSSSSHVDIELNGVQNVVISSIIKTSGSTDTAIKFIDVSLPYNISGCAISGAGLHHSYLGTTVDANSGVDDLQNYPIKWYGSTTYGYLMGIESGANLVIANTKANKDNFRILPDNSGSMGYDAVSAPNYKWNLTGHTSTINNAVTDSLLINGQPQVTNSFADIARFIGASASRSSFYLQNTNSVAAEGMNFDNDRGGFASYAGFSYGNSANATSLFGQTRADKFFIYADGGNNLGWWQGTLNNVPWAVGTNNTERFRISGGGLWSLNTTAGTAGQVPQVNSGATAMQWASINSIDATRAHTIFTPTTGGTVALVNNQYNIINPAGALVALTVNLPSSPANNDVVYIKFTQTVSTVTYGNGTVVDGITAPTAGGLTILVYDSGTTSWY